MSRKIYVFADWEVFKKPTLIGVLRADVVKGKEHFSFAYDDVWLQSEFAQQIDPELRLYAGKIVALIGAEIGVDHPLVITINGADLTGPGGLNG